MIRNTIPGKNNYGISSLHNITGDEKLAVIISHGFGSSKESPTAMTLAETLTSRGIGAFAYDFPGHGESPVGGEMLRIENCLDDLAAVEAHVRTIAPQAEIMYFSSSFGAYINLIYLARRTHAGSRSFLRSAAVDMPGIFRKGETPELTEQLKEQGYFIMDLDYVRPLKVTREFCHDLASNDVFSLYKQGIIKSRTQIAMIHGEADETASVKDARCFASQSGADLLIVEGGSHRLMEPGQTDLVMKTAMDFFIAS
ncbi:MAG: alpha/beta hydrolase [Anaerovoracaceae bacterium]